MDQNYGYNLALPNPNYIINKVYRMSDLSHRTNDKYAYMFKERKQQSLRVDISSCVHIIKIFKFVIEHLA